MLPLSIVLWALTVGTLCLTVTLGIILAYHWARYAMNTPLAYVTMVTYASGSGVLFLLLVWINASISML